MDSIILRIYHDHRAKPVTELRFKFSKGFSYISAIISHPHVKIPVLLLAEKHRLSKTKDDIYRLFGDIKENYQAPTGYNICYGERGIELSDRQAIKECKERLNTLNSEIAVLMSKPGRQDDLLSGLERERQEIIKYLKETYNFYLNMIRLTGTEADRISHAVSTAVYRSIRIIEDLSSYAANTLRSVISINEFALYTPKTGVEIRVVLG